MADQRAALESEGRGLAAGPQYRRLGAARHARRRPQFALAYWTLPYVEQVPVTDAYFFQWYVPNVAASPSSGRLPGS